jgi:hypothetical protein
MSEIKTLADQLRASLKNGSLKQPEVVKLPVPAKNKGKPDLIRDEVFPESLSVLFQNIESFEHNGMEKLPIRLDEKTAYLLKQLKIIKGIDMTKMIAFSLNSFFKAHPELVEYIKQNIKTIEL